MKKHTYAIKTSWTGNLGSGTKNYKAYSRNHNISELTKSHDILCSSDPSFLGDRTRYNPEELLVASIASCHMLWYLHLCTSNNIVVLTYEDNAEGTLIETRNGSGKFESVTLFPQVTIANADKVTLASKLHEEAHHLCFIANSCNFEISHQPKITLKK